jgi:mono/diheme cytochrome c family protein
MYRKFYLTLSLISGLIFFAFLVFAGYKEISPEWKKYQVEYKKLLIKNAKDDVSKQLAKSFNIGIQQIFLSSLKRADRCTSCHIGVENPLMADAEIVYKQHSGNYLKDHEVNRFGCTVCHNGQGSALNIKQAHAIDRKTHWDYPIMPLKYVQSSCPQCHDFEMLRQTQGKIVAKGEKLFREKGCKGCHKLNGMGGTLGNSLDKVGSQPFAFFPMRYLKGEPSIYAWHQQHFEDPRKLALESEMKVDIKGKESEFLSTYILSLKSEELPREYRRIQDSPARLEEAMDGESLYKMYCVACHTSGKLSIYDEIFSRTIPAVMNVDFLKSIDDNFLKKIIEQGRSNTQMTAWKSDAASLSDKKINKLVKYITRDRPMEKSAPFEFSKFNGNIVNGETLYETHCEFCHGPNGEGGSKVLGISLNNPVVQKEAKPEFLSTTIRDGRSGTPMVAFGHEDLGFKDQDIVDVVTYVRTLSSKGEEGGG